LGDQSGYLWASTHAKVALIVGRDVVLLNETVYRFETFKVKCAEGEYVGKGILSFESEVFPKREAEFPSD